ncbi:unnamed protein product [Leptosia nina]|uniref:Uncharacterized protein n=1 Tax=Leptosia nina TaxID=320188 RepID=A0AAV1J551_9NEOP
MQMNKNGANRKISNNMERLGLDKLADMYGLDIQKRSMVEVMYRAFRIRVSETAIVTTRMSIEHAIYTLALVRREPANKGKSFFFYKLKPEQRLEREHFCLSATESEYPLCAPRVPFAPRRESGRKVQILAVMSPPTLVLLGALYRAIHHSDPTGVAYRT